ncbi:MAG: peptidylprolyl isomerase [Chromatiales bacterium]|nr:peptidylprolyl isomerase [Chromatiales bacterium]
MRHLRITLLIALLAVTGFRASAQTLELSATGELLDGVAAVVNDGVVLKSELAVEMDRIVARLQEQGTPMPPARQLAQQVLERLVITRIQLQRAERLGIQVPDELVNQALAGVAQRNNIPLADLPGLLAAEGINYNSYRRELREQLMLEQLRQRDVISRIVVTPREIEEFLARQEGRAFLNHDFRISHILVSLSAGADSSEVNAARERIEDIHRRVLAGEEFAELAIAYSDGQQALEGGSLGWRRGDELPSLFQDVAPQLAPGEVSAPIRSASGFHLVRLDERRGGERIVEDQTRVRHILLAPNEVLDDAAIQQRLVEIRRQIIEDGADFAAVARVVSEDPGSAIDGGDLGWSVEGDFVPEFQQTIDGLGLGEISKPFRTPFGWHIAEVTERRTHDATADYQRQQAIMAVRNSKLGEETELWTRRLRDEAFVEYRM